MKATGPIASSNRNRVLTPGDQGARHEVNTALTMDREANTLAVVQGPGLRLTFELSGFREPTSSWARTHGGRAFEGLIAGLFGPASSDTRQREGSG